jgi:Rrf2 family protein
MIRNDTDYALRMLLALAREPRGWRTAPDLAGQAGVPRDFAHKILRQLAAAGILQAKAGRHGGFLLDTTPRQVSLLDVITAVQGPLQFNRCTNDPAVCAHQPLCRIHTKLRELQQLAATFLAATPLTEMVTPARPSPTTKRTRKG